MATTQSSAVFWLKQHSWTGSFTFDLLLELACKRQNASHFHNEEMQKESGLEKKVLKQSDVLKLKNALKSHFPKGVTEMDFVGSAEEVGENHTTFLCSWLAVKKGTSKEVERKAVQESAGQKMASSSVNSCVDKLREVRKMWKKGEKHEDRCSDGTTVQRFAGSGDCLAC